MLLDINKFIEDNELKFITTANITVSDKMDPNGLFSNEIFGSFGTKKWRNTYAAISLNTYVLHPVLYEIVLRKCSILLKLFDGRVSVIKTQKGIPILLDNSNGNYGIDFFHTNTLDCVTALLSSGKVTESGKKLLQFIQKNELSFINNIIVIPPAYRPLSQRFQQIQLHPINEKYISILTESQIVKGSSSSSKIFKKVLIKLQNSVYEAYREIQSLIKGKTGLQRSSLLGKTLDFSGRAVIVGNPEIRPNEIGIPFTLAITIFSPFIIYKSTHEYAHEWQKIGVRPSMIYLNKILENVKSTEKTIAPEIKSLLLKILNDVIKDKVVLAKRDPADSRASIRAFKPVIVEQSSIHINPLLTGGFGADFDGDQMAIYLPITEKAQLEAKTKMTTEAAFIMPTGELTLAFNNDVIFGVYLMTPDPRDEKPIPAPKTLEEAKNMLINTMDPEKPVLLNNKVTSLGRCVFYYITNYLPDKQLSKKTIHPYFKNMLKTDSTSVLTEKMYQITKLALVLPTLLGKVMNATEFALPDEFQKRKEEALKSENPGEALEKLTKEFLQYKKDNNSLIWDLIDSGGRGSPLQIQQTCISKGYISDVMGRSTEKPIAGSLNDGLTPEEYFASSGGGRKGIIDRAINTAVTGYLTRKYIYALVSVKFDPKLTVCSTKHFLKLNIEDELMANALKNRYTKDNKLITDPTTIIGKTVEIYSPMFCASPKICRRCLGDTPYVHLNLENIGISTAHTLGSSMTSMSMKTFHTGGSIVIKTLSKSEPRLASVCKQEGTDIISLKDFEIIIDEELAEGDINSEIITSSFIIRVKDEEDINVDLDYNFIINPSSPENVIREDNKIIINVLKNTVFGSMSASVTDLAKMIQVALRLIDNRTVIMEELLVRLWRLYTMASSSISMLPIEILVSQLHRDPTNLTFPYRLSNFKYAPYRCSLKQISLLENWKRGAAFENVSDALHYGILYGSGSKTISSDIDDLLKY